MVRVSIITYSKRKLVVDEQWSSQTAHQNRAANLCYNPRSLTQFRRSQAGEVVCFDIEMFITASVEAIFFKSYSAQLKSNFLKLKFH